MIVEELGRSFSLQQISLDLRFVLRSLCRRRAFTWAAVLTIALAVGADSAVFSVIYCVLMKPLPFWRADRLLQLSETDPTLRPTQVSFPDYRDWQRSAKSFREIAAYTFEAMNHASLLGQGDPEPIQGTMASYHLFPMMGIRMLKGRSFNENEEQDDSRVAVLSQQLWKRKFNSDPSIVGRAIQIDSLAFTVVGVVAQKQAFPAWADFWMPLSLAEPMLRNSRRFRPLEVVGRLNEGVSIDQARVELSGISANLARAYPATNQNRSSRLLWLRDQETLKVRPALLASWIAVNLVLLMACANVAHLLLVRTTSRERELAIRASLGASPHQILRLLSLENIAIIGIGSMLGSGVAALALPFLRSIAAARVPRIDNLRFDPMVWTYAVGVMAVLGALVGIPSFIGIMRANLSVTVHKGDVRLFSRSQGKLGSTLMVSEIGMAFVSFAIALLLVRSFVKLMEVPPGFSGKNVLALNIVLSRVTHGWDESAQIFNTRLAPALATVPGVQAVAEANVAPMGLDEAQISRFSTRFAIPAKAIDPAKTPTAQLRWVSQDYFKVLHIPLLSGELLQESDRGKDRYLVNRTLARQFFSGQNPVGQKLLLDADTPTPHPAEIVGVVGDVRDLGLDVEMLPTIYEINTSPVLTLFLSTARNPSSSIARIREAIRNSNPEATISRVQTVDQLVSDSVARYRFALWLMVGFAVLATILSAVGVYGVVAFSVAHRTREFGIRSAVGARPFDLAALVLSEGMKIALAGIALGLVLTWVFARFVQSILFRVGTTDPLALTLAGLFLLILCVVTMLIPAARASRTVPAIVLREE